MGRAAPLWLMFNIVVKTDGWWAGGQPLSTTYPPFVNSTSNVTNGSREDGSSLSFFSFGRFLQGASPTPSPPVADPTGVPPGAPSPSVDGELSWGWWSVSLLVEWAIGRVFSTRDTPGSAATRGGWAGYLVDRSVCGCLATSGPWSLGASCFRSLWVPSSGSPGPFASFARSSAAAVGDRPRKALDRSRDRQPLASL